MIVLYLSKKTKSVIVLFKAVLQCTYRTCLYRIFFNTVQTRKEAKLLLSNGLLCSSWEITEYYTPYAFT